jgi:hypothetical protein
MMLPQDGMVGGVPAPMKDRIASTTRGPMRLPRLGPSQEARGHALWHHAPPAIEHKSVPRGSYGIHRTARAGDIGFAHITTDAAPDPAWRPVTISPQGVKSVTQECVRPRLW